MFLQHSSEYFQGLMSESLLQFFLYPLGKEVEESFTGVFGALSRKYMTDSRDYFDLYLRC